VGNVALFPVRTTNSGYSKTKRKSVKRTKRHSQENKETKQ